MSSKTWFQEALSSYGPKVGGVACLSILFWCATESLSFGLSRLYVARAVENNDLPTANQAVRLTRSDPLVYRGRAALLAREENFRAAINDLEHAINLSPNDADLWIELGKYHGGLHDTAGALRAYRQATKLAPGYGHAHELLGDCLLEAGLHEEAFVELRHASRNRPALFSENIELAWQTYKGEPQAMRQALQPESVHERIALGLFFANHSVRDQSITLMKDARFLPAEERELLLRELLDTGKFEEAYEVWMSGREVASIEIRVGAGSITDGGFEGKLSVEDPGFGWRFNNDIQAVNVWLDPSEPNSGRQSLRLDWHGDADRSSRIVAQLVLVAPETRYRLSFAGRTRSLTTICLPYISLTSGKEENEILLGQSTPLPQGSSGWQNYSVDFSTPRSPQAIEVSVKRVAGTEESCPIFGSLWLDDFSLVKL